MRTIETRPRNSRKRPAGGSALEQNWVFAAGLGDLAALKALHAATPSICLFEDTYGTALHAAAAYGHVDALHWLVEAGVPIAACSNRGQTALHLAAHFGHAEAVHALLCNRASHEARDKDGLTPLHHACNVPCINHLLGAGAMLQARGSGKHENTTCLSICRRRAATATGVTPQQQANEALRLVEALTKRENAWFRAVRMCDCERMLSLINKGQWVDARYPTGDFALNEAVRQVRPDAVRLLLEQGADVNRAGASGLRPLHHLYETLVEGHRAGAARLLPILLGAGARTAVRDAYGLSVMDYTTRRIPGMTMSEAVRRERDLFMVAFEPAARLERNMRRWGLVGRLAGRLCSWHARAAERAYAPGGGGFREAEADFAEGVEAGRAAKMQKTEDGGEPAG